MGVQQTVEINSVETVLRELAPLIDEVQRALEQSLETDDVSAGTEQVTRRLDEIRGTLQLLDLVGPAMLAREMRALSAALADGSIRSLAAGLEALLKAVFRLPDYLDRLRSGRHDRPVVLLPLMNELRAARGAEPLDERELFFPRLDHAATADDDAVDRAALEETARRLRPRFQRALLGWYRGHDAETQLAELGAVLQELAGTAGTPAVQRLWRVCGALTESLADQGLEADTGVKVLMGRVERLLSQLVRGGERSLERQIPIELLRNLLYYVARSGSGSARVREVKETYHLDELLPNNEARADFEGPNRELLEVVGQGIRDDLAQVKDAIEIYVHSDERRPDVLEGLPERIKQVADTFSMLGLAEAHDTLQRESDALAGIESLDAEHADWRLQELADVLLRVESDLVELQNGRPRDGAATGDGATLGIRSLPDSEYRPLLSAVVASSLDDLSKVREAIGAYCDDPEIGQEAVAEVPALIEEVHGAIAMLPLSRAAPLLSDLRDHVQKSFVQRGERPDEHTQMLLADVVAGLEYYLEAVDYDRAGMTHLLESAARAMAALDAGGKPETYAEDEQVVIESDLEVEADSGRESGDYEEESYELSSEDADPAGPDVAAPAADAAAGNGIYDLSTYQDDDLSLEDLGEDGDRDGPDDEAPASGLEEPVPRGGDEAAGPAAGAEAPALDFDLGDDASGSPAAGSADEVPDGPSDAARPPATGPDATITEPGQDLDDLAVDFDFDTGDGATGLAGPDTGAGDADLPALDETPAADGASSAQGGAPAPSDGPGGSRAAVDTGEAAGPGGRASPGVDPDASGSQLAILGEDVDDEIVDVFIEEALGELDRINEHLPRWKSSPNDEEPLVIVRRAYHTLKGGGRLIGAELVGEFSWAMEDLLNRVIERSVATSQAVFDTLDEASAALPQLIEQLRGNRAPIDGIDDLIERAHALSRGEDGPPTPGGGSGGDDPPPGGDDSGGADPAASGGAAPTGATAQASATVNAGPAGAGAPAGDTLLQVFTNEAEMHQAVLRAAFGMPGDEARTMNVDQNVRRALHTLVGSAQTADVDSIAELAGRMEEIARARREGEERLTTREVDLFREAVARIDDILAVLPQAGDVATDDIQTRLDTQRHEAIQATVPPDDGEGELLDIFLEEGDELLEACDRAVSRWREDPEDRDVIGELQRSLHTLKGGARMANFPPIADLTHEVESLVNAIDEGVCAPTEDVLDLLHEAVDALTVLLEQARGRQPVARVDWLIEDLQNLRLQGGGADANDTVPAVTGDDAGTSEGDEIPSPATPEPETPQRGGGRSGAQGRAQGQGGVDQIRVQSELLDNLVNFAGEVSIYHSRLGEQMGQYRFNLNEFEQTVKRLRDQLRTMENETESQILYRHEKEADERTSKDFDPLEFDRYTRIQELSRSLAESVGDLDSIKDILDNLTRDAETLLLQQSRVSSELQDGLMQTRMVRFDGLRARLNRVVRQTAGTVGKKAQLVMSGGEIEVDRSIQERIVAPLEHILRNAVSHGIERPGRRHEAGKPEQGTVRLDLHRGGTDIIIEVTDDGKGIDPAAVRRKGIEKGLIAAEDELGDNDVIKLILETGFSTADEVTQISGRGVGMDVVDAEIRRLGGTLAIHTEKGVGTRFTVRLPVTLAINQAVLVSAGEDTYAIPIASIEGVSQVPAGELKQYYIDGSRTLSYAGNEYRVQHLGTLLGVSEPRLEDPDISYPVIMIRAGDERVALHIDQLVGRREVVVKPLGAPLNLLSGISGATVMADGTVVLILDIGGLLRTESRFVATGSLYEGDAEGASAARSEEAHAPTVLVVDDSITIRKVTQRILARNGINVATAKDGVDALSWMSQSVPDLILLDIEMPRMDGYEVAAYVRSEQRLADVPIIMITSRTGDKHRQRAEDVGVDRYLGKPYQEMELMEHIRELIRTPEAA